MASKKLQFASTAGACKCRNMCNRVGRRNGCDCLADNLYCTDLCSCGTAKSSCTNYYGSGGPLDRQLGVTDENTVEPTVEPTAIIAGNEKGHVQFHVDDLNRSLQEVINEEFENNGVLDSSWERNGRSLEEGFNPTEVDDMLAGMDSTKLSEILSTILKEHPHMVRYVKGSDPKPPQKGNVKRWCHCGRCVPMGHPDEEHCCRGAPDGPCTLEEHANQIEPVVLNEITLAAAIRNRNDLFALQDDIHNNRCLRHCAYRQYILWRFGHLGPGVRRVVPSCVVTKIRSLYPAPNGMYTGWKANRFA